MGFRLIENKKPRFLDIIRDITVLLAIGIFLIFIVLSSPRGHLVPKRRIAKFDLKEIWISIAMYKEDMGNYFGNYSGIIGDINSPDPLYIGLINPNNTLRAQPNFSKDWSGPYLDKINKDPWGEHYYYTNNKADVDETNKQVGTLIGEDVPDRPYYLYSKGKDKLTGLRHNADDITSWDENNTASNNTNH
ncbi:MAG: type II secretion system protein GspG [Candidatus Omnitrophota bacterium]